MDGDWSHYIKICLLLGRKAMTNLDSILKKQRHYFADKVLTSQSYSFSIVMYGWESWTINEGRVPKNWCFWTVVLEKTLESPLNSKEIKPINPNVLEGLKNIHWKDWCWSWSSNTLATWCEELTHWKRPWCWERLKAGGEGDDRGWHGRMSWHGRIDGHEFE